MTQNPAEVPVLTVRFAHARGARTELAVEVPELQLVVGLLSAKGHDLPV